MLLLITYSLQTLSAIKVERELYKTDVNVGNTTYSVNGA